jgi:hypothetical protein
MKRTVRVVLGLTLLGAGPTWAQAAADSLPDVQQQLVARGAPPELAAQVQQIVSRAANEGLPTGPIADKALEGWAKRAPADRLLMAAGDLRVRLAAGRQAALEAQVQNPPAALVAAAAQALGRGMTPEDVRTLVRSAGPVEAATTGLMVASSLAAQGIGRTAATRAVERAFRDGRTPSQVLELPSVAAALIARGMSVGEVTTRMLAGNPLGVERPDPTLRAVEGPAILTQPPVEPPPRKP